MALALLAHCESEPRPGIALAVLALCWLPVGRVRGSLGMPWARKGNSG
jgi:hypothetical protein